MKECYTKKAASARPKLASPAAGEMISSELEQLVRDGARRMLQEALDIEVNEFLERARYERGEGFSGLSQRPRLGANYRHRSGRGKLADAPV